MTVNLNSQAKVAEIIERHRLVFVVFIFLIGLGSGFQVLEYYYPRDEYSWMNLLRTSWIILQVTALGIILFNVVRLRALCSSRACQQQLLEGFVERANLIALATSWFFTFFMAMAISEWTEPEVMFLGPREPDSLFPPRYYVHLLVFCMTVCYSLAFLVLYLRNGADSAGEEE